MMHPSTQARSGRKAIFPLDIEERYARMTIGFLGLVHMTLALALLLVLLLIGGNALAQERIGETEEACGGRNLIEVLRRDDPDRLASIEEEAAQLANGEGLFWRVSRPGTEESWLYGTMHVADPRVLALGDSALAAFEKARLVVVESAEIIDLEQASLAILANPDLTMFTDGTTLRSLLSVEDYALVEAALAEQGIPAIAVDRMKPWMILGMLTMTDCERAAEATGELFLDARLAVDAVEAGKALEGLETIEEQLAAMESLPMELHVQGLIETLSLASLLDDLLTTTTELYVDGRIGMIMPMLRNAAPTQGDGDAESYAEFEERIILARNRTMAERSLPLLETGGAFIAVGALHLPGEEGLIELLRDAGYTVTRAD